MPITLHDSLTRAARELRPAHPDGVYRFYNCGPTVYAAAHIGNFRTFVVNDLLRRLLELEFGPDKVKHVRNLTDVDDKTIRRAREEGRPLAEVTKQWTDKFHADCAALGCLPPHVEPAATAHIPEQVSMIEVLMEKGNAYRSADGSVYFKVSSFSGYGALSRVKERELRVGSALAAKPQGQDADEKEDGSDFALWKAHKPEDGDARWPGPRDAAAGRPGWHIECSAMSKKHLGETIDLHTGGVDLLFPHHENEIAQSQCCNGGAIFAHHWYHSEHLLVDGKKMSKSLGNLYTLDQLREMDYSPETLRYTLLAGHPRKQLNFTLQSRLSSSSALGQLEKFNAKLHAQYRDVLTASPSKIFDPVFDALREDLNTPAALGALFTIIHAFGPTPESSATAEDFVAFRRVVGVFGFKLTTSMKKIGGDPTPPEVAALADQRWAAKAAKNWAEADRLRGAIAALGWTMLDRKDGYSLEPAKK